MNVQFLDIAALHSGLKSELNEVFSNVVTANQLILGPELAQFELEFADFCGARFAVGVSDGLEALQMLLEAHGIGPGDEVIVPSNTFIATWLAVTACGATPVAVEPDEKSYNITAGGVEKAITPRTRAVIAVHLYGLPVDIEELEDLAAKTGIFLFEDAAQAHGASTSNGRMIGGFGSGAAFSFYPGKNLGALGDGGAVTTNDEKVAQFVRLRRNYGSSRKYVHQIAGRNSRLDELQAAILRLKLRHLPKWNRRREEIADYYNRNINSDVVVLPVNASGHQSAHHLYVLRTKRRDALQEYLTARGIGSGVHYPIPPHAQKCYADLGLSLPIAAALSNELISIPIGPTLTDEQVSYVVENINTFFAKA